MGMLAAKLHAIATMISLPEMQFNIFMIWSLQSIHTESAKLYSRKVISRMACPANLWGGKFDPPGPTLIGLG
jgi:hypothetical protein